MNWSASGVIWKICDVVMIIPAITITITTAAIIDGVAEEKSSNALRPVGHIRV